MNLAEHIANNTSSTADLMHTYNVTRFQIDCLRLNDRRKVLETIRLLQANIIRGNSHGPLSGRDTHAIWEVLYHAGELLTPVQEYLAL